MNKVKLIIALGLFFGTTVYGQQDVHFSQFFSSPLTLNPANAGIFNGDLRGIMNYRTKWGSISKSYATSAASLDAPVLKNSKGGMFGLGLNFFKDLGGDSKLSTVNYALSLAYHLDISGGKDNHFLSIGFQGGMLQRSILYDNLTWDNQWNGATFDRQITPSNIGDLGGVSVKVLDLATGLHWYFAPSDGTRFHGGASMFHVNTPNVGFNVESKLLKKLTIHGGGEIAIQNGDAAVVSNFVIVIQGANKYTDFGGEFKYFLQKGSKYTNYKNVMFMSVGPYLRWRDAAYIVGRFTWNGITASMSYDFNLSRLSTVSKGNGGVEMMLGYQVDLSNSSRGHNLNFR